MSRLVPGRTLLQSTETGLVTMLYSRSDYTCYTLPMKKLFNALEGTVYQIDMNLVLTNGFEAYDKPLLDLACRSHAPFQGHWLGGQGLVYYVRDKAVRPLQDYIVLECLHTYTHATLDLLYEKLLNRRLPSLVCTKQVRAEMILRGLGYAEEQIQAALARFPSKAAGKKKAKPEPDMQARAMAELIPRPLLRSWAEAEASAGDRKIQTLTNYLNSRTCAHTHRHIHTHPGAHAYTHTDTHTHKNTDTHIKIDTHKHRHTHTLTHAHTLTHTNRHIPTHTNAQTPM